MMKEEEGKRKKKMKKGLNEDEYEDEGLEITTGGSLAYK